MAGCERKTAGIYVLMHICMYLCIYVFMHVMIASAFAMSINE